MNDEEVINLMRAKVCVFSESVLCLGRVRELPESNVEWEKRLQWIKNSKQYRQSNRINGKPTEFEWMIFPGFTTLQILREIQKLMDALGCEPEHFQEESSSCRCTNNEKVCVANSIVVAEYAKKFSSGYWSSLGPGSETKWNATDTYKSCGQRDKVADFMMLNFRESGHPIILATGALQRGTLKSKRGGRFSIHFCGDYNTVEVIFCTIVCVNQFSIYGAVADLCEEYIPPPASRGQPVSSAEKSESLVSAAKLLNVQRPLLTNWLAQGNQLQNHKERVENLPGDGQLITLCTDAAFI